MSCRIIPSSYCSYARTFFDISASIISSLIQSFAHSFIHSFIDPSIIMHSSTMLPALLVLVLSSFSNALPQNTGTIDQSGAKVGCRPIDFIKLCANVKPLAGGAEDIQGEYTAAGAVAGDCGGSCWPALAGGKVTDFSPSDCSVSSFPYSISFSAQPEHDS